MNLSNNMSDKSLFQGIKYADGLPLIANDLHELEDTARMSLWNTYKSMKKAGLLAEADLSYSSSNLLINNPFPIMVPGGYVQIIGSSNGKVQATNLAGDTYVCLVGWFQLITSSSTIREYGGLSNNTMTNNLYMESLGVQPSSRYQFVWMIKDIPIQDISGDAIDTTIVGKNASGSDSTNWSISSEEKSGDFYIAQVDSESHIIDSKVYVLPIAIYRDGAISAILPSGVNADVLISSTAPEGSYSQGTQWYNNITHEFCTYIKGEGWVQQTAKIGYIRYQESYTVPANVSSPTISIPIQDFSANDILRVLYEGLELSPGVHYTLNTTNKTITLLEFPVHTGEVIVFSSTRFVGTYDITNSTLESITLHANTKANSTVFGHVKLSDNAGNQTASSGIAVTPKALSDAIATSQILTDDSDSTQYKLGISNGLLYYEEV